MTNKGVGTGGPARVAGGAAEEAAQPALIAAGPLRRTLTAEQKQAIIEAYEAADPAGRRALLEFQRISASTVRRWRRAAEAVPGGGDQGEAGAAAPVEAAPVQAAPPEAVAAQAAPPEAVAAQAVPAGGAPAEGAPVQTAVGPGVGPGSDNAAIGRSTAFRHVPTGLAGELGSLSQILQLQRVLVVGQDAVSATRPGADKDPYPKGDAGRAAAIEAAVGTRV